MTAGLEEGSPRNESLTAAYNVRRILGGTTGEIHGMKKIITILILTLPFVAYAQNPKPVTLRSSLLEQLHTTHDQKDWFVPINVAVQGLTAEQANWKDSSGNHSAGQLTYHLLFWNRRELMK